MPFDADGLRAAGRDLAVPFQVQLADGRLLQMQRLLRLLPGKRIAGEASLEGRRVFAKLFVAKAGERHWLAECKGVGRLPPPASRRRKFSWPTACGAAAT